jgi:NAD(P)-dependent dehydrogenase (short-subunit alcohol dehydrogenase family)
MKGKNVLIFGCSGQIGRSIVRKLTKDNYIVTAVTRNIHQKGIILKPLGNAGYINIEEANIFDEKKN